MFTDLRVHGALYTDKQIDERLWEMMAGKGSSAKLDVGVLSAEQQDKLRQFKVGYVNRTIKLKSYIS